MTNDHWLIFLAVMIPTWFVFIYFWPRLMLLAYKRGLLAQGFGEGPVPVNTLYTQPKALFADPVHPPASAPKALTSGVNHDTLLAAGWLDLSKGPLVLHVPDMNDRYYSVQLTDPSKNTVFAYVGKRTTGTQAGDYLITPPGWKGQAPGGMRQIVAPINEVIVIGRVLVYSDSDLETAYELSKQIQLTPFAQFQPGQAR